MKNLSIHDFIILIPGKEIRLPEEIEQEQEEIELFSTDPAPEKITKEDVVGAMKEVIKRL